METITQFRMPDGSVLRLVDWVDKPVYSTVELNNAFTDDKIDAFTYSKGDDVPATGAGFTQRTSFRADTNISVGGANASTEEILVYAIKPEYFELQLDPNNATDMSTAAVRAGGQPLPRASVLGILADALVLRLKISQKGYAEGGLAYFNTGFGAFAALNTQTIAAAGNPRSIATAGLPGQGSIRSFVTPHHIGGTEKYQLALHNFRGATVTFLDEDTTPNTLTNVVYRLRIYLDGMRKRPTA